MMESLILLILTLMTYKVYEAFWRWYLFSTIHIFELKFAAVTKLYLMFSALMLGTKTPVCTEALEADT